MIEFLASEKLQLQKKLLSGAYSKDNPHPAAVLKVTWMILMLPCSWACRARAREPPAVTPHVSQHT